MIKVSELSGAQLDYWVARANGRPANEIKTQDGICLIKPRRVGSYVRPFQPSTDWSDGGPLIEKYRIFLDNYVGEDCWCAYRNDRTGSYGDSPLQAICRAVVRSVFGEEVEDDQSI